MNKTILVIVPEQITVNIIGVVENTSPVCTQINDEVYNLARKMCRLPEIDCNLTKIIKCTQIIPTDNVTEYSTQDLNQIVPELMKDFNITKFQAIYIYLRWCKNDNRYIVYRIGNSKLLQKYDGEYLPLRDLCMLQSAINYIRPYTTPHTLKKARNYNSLMGEHNLKKAVDIYNEQKE